MCPNEWTDAAIFLALLGDASSLAHLVAEVVQLGATDATMTNDLELGDLGAVKREGTLNTDTEGNLADGEGLTGTGAAMRMTSPWKTWMRSRSPSLMR